MDFVCSVNVLMPTNSLSRADSFFWRMIGLLFHRLASYSCTRSVHVLEGHHKVVVITSQSLIIARSQCTQTPSCPVLPLMTSRVPVLGLLVEEPHHPPGWTRQEVSANVLADLARLSLITGMSSFDCILEICMLAAAFALCPLRLRFKLVACTIQSCSSMNGALADHPKCATAGTHRGTSRASLSHLSVSSNR